MNGSVATIHLSRGGMSTDKPPKAQYVVAQCALGTLTLHPSREPLRAQVVGSMIFNVQSKFTLQRGSEGGWNEDAWAELRRILSSPKAVRGAQAAGQPLPSPAMLALGAPPPMAQAAGQPLPSPAMLALGAPPPMIALAGVPPVPANADGDDDDDDSDSSSDSSSDSDDERNDNAPAPVAAAPVAAEPVQEPEPDDDDEVEQRPMYAQLLDDYTELESECVAKEAEINDLKDRVSILEWDAQKYENEIEDLRAQLQKRRCDKV